MHSKQETAASNKLHTKGKTLQKNLMCFHFCMCFSICSFFYLEGIFFNVCAFAFVCVLSLRATI